MSSQDTETATDGGTLDLYRNETTSTFDAHLFEAADVEAADGADGKSDAPVASLCSRTTSYGPFKAVDMAGAEFLLGLFGDDTDARITADRFFDVDAEICGTCVESLERRLREASLDVEVEDPGVDPDDMTVEGLEQSLDDLGLTDAQLRGLYRAEVEGPDRLSARRAIRQAFEDDGGEA